MEALRDSLLFVSGNLDAKAGGPPAALDDKNKRRTVYGFVSRRKLDRHAGAVRFPNPNSTSEQRMVTNVPLQRLFFMNSSSWSSRRQALAQAADRDDDGERVRQAYRICVRAGARRRRNCSWGWRFVTKSDWTEYAQVLLSSNEFLLVE